MTQTVSATKEEQKETAILNLNSAKAANKPMGRRLSAAMPRVPGSAPDPTVRGRYGNSGTTGEVLKMTRTVSATPRGGTENA
eukprot:231112-Hanusia_phi.AAC.1